MFGMYFVFAIKYTTKFISVDSRILLRLVALDRGLVALDGCLLALDGGLVALNWSLLANQDYPPIKKQSYTSATTTKTGGALEGGLLALNRCLIALNRRLLALNSDLLALNRSLLANQDYPPIKKPSHKSATATKIGLHFFWSRDSN